MKNKQVLLLIIYLIKRYDEYCYRRAVSTNLPMAMRFRILKETSKASVGVYYSHIHGRGLFCLRDIEPGEMVIEYAGEVSSKLFIFTYQKITVLVIGIAQRFAEQSTGVDVEYIDSKFNMATTNYSSQLEKYIDHTLAQFPPRI